MKCLKFEFKIKKTYACISPKIVQELQPAIQDNLKMLINKITHSYNFHKSIQSRSGSNLFIKKKNRLLIRNHRLVNVLSCIKKCLKKPYKNGWWIKTQRYYPFLSDVNYSWFGSIKINGRIEKKNMKEKL